MPRTDSLRMITLDRLTVTVLRHHQGHHHRGPHFPPLASYSRVQLGRDGPGIIQKDTIRRGPALRNLIDFALSSD